MLWLARGDRPMFSPPPTSLPSPLDGVPDAAWTKFIFALETQAPSAISDSNGLGCFEMRPKRLEDLGVMTDLRAVRRGGRQVFVGNFVPPYTLAFFLRSWPLQYTVLRTSILLHFQALPAILPATMTASGALALLHRGGPSAFKAWSNPEKRFETTKMLFERTNGIF